MQTFLLVITLVIIIGYILMMRKLKQNVRAMDEVDFNLSVASYKPNLKPGNYQVTVTNLGADYQSTLATVNRFRAEPLAAIAVGEIATSGLNIYSCEDLLYELQYIGADGNITEMETNDK